MKILTVVGARPQLIKAFPLSLELKKRGIEEYILHTGQHYDYNMSGVFIEEFGGILPYRNLNVGSGSQGKQTADILVGVENELLELKPDCLVVFGDTNSTLGASLAASKLQTPIVHIEAGLRSFNRSMPEEINRVLTDHISDVLCCPSSKAIKQLEAEGITNNVYNTGDIMFDSVKLIIERRENQPKTKSLNKGEILLTLHRPYNVDDGERLKSILVAVNSLDANCLFPIHPRTKTKLKSFNIAMNSFSNIKFIEPLSYTDMIIALSDSEMCITDSGGLQKEAYYTKTKCVTVRPETEWVELVDLGVNSLFNPETDNLHNTMTQLNEVSQPDKGPYGNGNSASQIVTAIEASV